MKRLTAVVEKTPPAVAGSFPLESPCMKEQKELLISTSRGELGLSVSIVLLETPLASTGVKSPISLEM